ncbi:hypothetical protein [Ferrovibrio xuzhouensis]|uniref:Restriction endonuclease n=1 Tax=Ferrovibrio xuzhouensis TaxID=1576914 RepID=A0ABV7VA82_9PROT
MDKSEKAAALYLSHQGYTNIKFEPDGNIPPDFVIDNRIAVEVRRLNQHFQTGDKTRGLEEAEYPLVSKLQKLLKQLGPTPPKESWYVFFQFSRPLPKWRIIKDHITQHLSHFSSLGCRENSDFRLTRNFKYHVAQTGELKDTYFRYGGHNDHDSGGWVVAEIIRNLDICVKEKSEKTAKYRSRYSEWWLVLPDHIGRGLLDENDKQQLRTAFKMRQDWDRIILVNPENPVHGFDI